MSERCKEERVAREVIENKLLARLADKDTAAILVNKDDLNLMISAFDSLWAEEPGNERAKEFVRDLRQLYDGAFPE